MDPIDALSGLFKSAGHKYKSRKRVGGKWIYDYGAGYGKGKPTKAKTDSRQMDMFGSLEPAPAPKKAPKKRISLNVIQRDPALTEGQRVRPISGALRRIMKRKLGDPTEWELPAGARVKDPWKPRDYDPSKRWSHPEHGSGQMGDAPWHENPEWAPDFHSYDHVIVNSSAGKDSQAMLTHMVEVADAQGYPREKLVVVHADLGRVEWEGTGKLAQEQAEHYGLRFEVVRRAQNDLVEQVEERHGDLVQKDTDVDALKEAGVDTWRQLAGMDQAQVLKVIGEGKGTSKWPGDHRAKELVRNATRKRNVAAKAHDKKIAKAQKSLDKAIVATSQKRIIAARAQLKKLKAMGDPWDWPVSFGKAIAWPSSDARYCTSDHKRAEVQKLLTRLADEHKTATGSKKPARILNALGLRAQESTSRAMMDSFDREKSTRNQTVDKWLPIHKWHESKVWDTIGGSEVPYHKAYDLGMRRLSCVFCVFAQKEDLMVAAKHNPKLFGTYLELEEKVGSSFKADHSLADVRDEIAKRRAEGYELNDLAQWVQKALRLPFDLVKSELQVEPTAVGLILEAAKQRLEASGAEIETLTLDWKPNGLCVHLDSPTNSFHVEYLKYSAAYNASMVAATFAQRKGLGVEENNAPGPLGGRTKPMLGIRKPTARGAKTKGTGR